MEQLGQTEIIISFFSIKRSYGIFQKLRLRYKNSQDCSHSG